MTENVCSAYLFWCGLFHKFIDGLFVVGFGLSKPINTGLQSIVSRLANVLVFGHGRLKKISVKVLTLISQNVSS